jgi:hypothetical protein
MHHAPRFLIAVLSACGVANAQWQQSSLTTSPGPLVGPAMAGDLNGTILLSGGDTGSFPAGLTTASWLYSQGTWLQVGSTGPSGRTEAQLVYDAQRQVWVLYGGWTSLFSIGQGNDQTWEFDGAAWSQAAPANTPGGFWKHAMCYDVVRGVTVLFGGSTNGLLGATDGTYEYDGSTWTQRNPSATPGWREQHSMCFHTGLGVSVMFGGFNALANSVQNETWTWDGTSWTLLPAVGPQPPARASAEMVYDATRGVCVLHGGNTNTGAVLTDTWEFNGVTWTQIPGAGPGGRSFGCAFDAGERLVVRHGGFGHAAETWTFGATREAFGAGCAGSSGVPALDAIDAPRLGAGYALVLDNLNPGVPVGFFVLSLTETPATSLAALGMPGCASYVGLDAVQGGAATAGVANVSVPLPNDLSLVGVPLLAQGLSFDPGVNPAWLTTSNGLRGVMGR